MGTGRLGGQLTTRGRAFAAAGGSLAACGVGLGFADLTRIGVLLLALPLMSLALLRRHRLGVSVERSAQPPRVHVGEPAEVTLAVHNTGDAVTPLMLAEEEIGYPLGDRPRFVVPRLRRAERHEVRYPVRPSRRGPHRLGPLRVRLRDPFGLSSRAVALAGTAELLVLPMVVPLGTAPRPEMGTGAEGAIPHMVALHGEDDASIRAYRDGDDLRRVHWPATARTGDLMVRQEDRPARRSAVVLLDCRASGVRGAGRDRRFEGAVTACASVTAHLAAQGYAVHLVTPETAESGRSAAPMELGEALEALALARTGPAEGWSRVIRAGQALTASGGLLLAVVGPLDEPAARELASLRRPGSTAVAIVVEDNSGRAGDPARGATVAAGACAGWLREAGWSAEVVTAGERLEPVWSSLTTALPAGAR
jgi:uncharacterized protein (DUF58 family)